MKKCYKAPEMEVVFVESEQILAGGDSGNGYIGENGQGTGIPGGEDNENGDAASYRSSLWN